MGRTYSIRRNLIFNLVLVITLLSGAIFITTSFAARRAIRNLSSKIIEQTIEQAEEELSGFFNPVSRELLRMKTMGEKELLVIDKPEKLNDLFKSIMQQYPQVTSVILARETGEEFMLLRKKDTWLNRWIGPDNQAKIIEWQADGQIISEKTIKLDYDPRKKPWFINATEKWNASKSKNIKNPEHLLSWTSPYIFFTTQEPGTTTSIRFQTPNRTEYVLGFDILLKDIQIFTDELKILNQGQFMILTTEDIMQVVSFSSRKYTSNPVQQGAVPLIATKDIGTPLIRDMVANLQKNENSETGDPIRFESEGKIWWGARKPFSITSERSLVICVLVPESDLLSDLEKSRFWILAITAGVLLIGLIHAITIANRFSRPIEFLVSSSNRISKGDFTKGAPIVSNMSEVLQLAEAHEHMRKGLKTLMKLESDIVVAREIQQKTFPTLLPKLSGFDIGGWNQPADETGGDSYDVIGYRMDPETQSIILCEDEARHAVLLLGDATGHGLGPALSVTQLRAMLRMGVHISPDIPLLLKHINKQLHADLPDGRFISAWLGQIDADRHMLTYFSAGQAPLLYYKDQENKVEVLRADIYPLGITDELDTGSTHHLEMNPGDIFAVISDGIFEASNSDDELFGTDRVVDILKKEKERTPDEIIDVIQDSVNQFTDNAPASDDRTMVIIKRQTG